MRGVKVSWSKALALSGLRRILILRRHRARVRVKKICNRCSILVIIEDFCAERLNVKFWLKCSKLGKHVIVSVFFDEIIHFH